MSNEATTTESVVPEALRADWMDMAEACRTLAKTRWTIADYCRDGILERQTYGRHVLISRASVNRFLDQFKVPAKQQKKATKKAARR